jgi:hypothetical protein
MMHRTATTKVEGLWRNLLVIESDAPITFESSEIQVMMDSSEGPITITYYSEGLYKEIYENDTHYYWFLYNSSKLTVDGDNEEVYNLKRELDEYTNALKEVIEE